LKFFVLGLRNILLPTPEKEKWKLNTKSKVKFIWWVWEIYSCPHKKHKKGPDRRDGPGKILWPIKTSDKFHRTISETKIKNGFHFGFHKSDTKIGGGFEKYSVAYPRKRKVKVKYKTKTSDDLSVKMLVNPPRRGGSLPLWGRGRGFHENWLKYFYWIFLYWVWEIFCYLPLRKRKVKVEYKIKSEIHMVGLRNIFMPT
jgi:hypothetical protein